eukprot:CAMPEP_0204579270 /NCGR_PEP_ID=MMETSP0661-20131031/43394_1 /ASSEMBLY_ACC=CAM_ASM_000606 /TAXON_ID=109239 /ORGANISM="Alexandrium margalefi, Strain AMGDE01CS-322" /LENGTH=233 /DNA_ID=CAMNT_0051588267 /DNA_START=74 /DNA_END=776 /DNA_ORIENTATION=+
MGFGDASKKDKQKAAASSASEASKKAAEDASWQEADKVLKSKEERASAKAAQADAKLAAKKERQELEAAEEATVSKLKGANKGSTKMTQAEIARRQALLAMSKSAAKPKKSEVVSAPKIEANTNREDVVEATGIDAALSALDTGSEKKGKVTYKEFEAQVLPQIQEENPGLKMSQAKEKAFKMWERSPDNPKNQEKEAAWVHGEHPAPPMVHARESGSALCAPCGVLAIGKAA